MQQRWKTRCSARLLMACVAEERSLTDLQRLSGETLPKLHYHITRLLDAGLLLSTVTNAERTAGTGCDLKVFE
jgi:hypothetical protein